MLLETFVLFVFVCQSSVILFIVCHEVVVSEGNMYDLDSHIYKSHCMVSSGLRRCHRVDHFCVSIFV